MEINPFSLLCFSAERFLIAAEIRLERGPRVKFLLSKRTESYHRLRVGGKHPIEGCVHKSPEDITPSTDGTHQQGCKATRPTTIEIKEQL